LTDAAIRKAKPTDFVGCDQLFREYSMEEIEAAVAADQMVYLGDLTPNARAAVAAALIGNRSLPPGRLGQLSEAWR
jgi:hypothetical protein